MPDLAALPDLVEQVAPSVVHVTADNGAGSGFAVGSEGLVITNAHVIERTTEPRIKLSVGEQTSSQVLGIDVSTDLALLRLAGGTVEPLELKPTKDIRVGESVIAVGSPIGLEWTVTAGIISAKDRTSKAPDGRQMQSMLQTDAAVNPGNSGGPLISLDGRAVGVNSQIIGPMSSGLGFAVPADTVQQTCDEILEHGHVERGVFGAKARTAPFFGEDIKRWEQRAGAELLSVRAGGPAHAAGLEPEDIVLGLDGEIVDEPGDIFRLLNRRRIGRPCEVRFLRDGKERIAEVTPVVRHV